MSLRLATHLAAQSRFKYRLGAVVVKRKGMTQIVLQNFDWVKLFTHLDDCFSKEIEESGRNPGFYEVKFDGRVEYRSLPSNINLKKVISVIQSFKWE